MRLIGGVGHDRGSLAGAADARASTGSTTAGSSPLDDRPTTLKERYIGRAQDRHPQQMIRVDYETRDPIPAVVEARLHAELPAALEWADVALDLRLRQRGLHAHTAPRDHRRRRARRRQGARRPDPIDRTTRGIAGVHCMTPNRLEAQLATGMTIAEPEDALRVGRKTRRGPRDGSRPGHARPRRHGAGPRRRPGRAVADPPPPGLRHHRRRRHGPRGRRPLPRLRGRLRRGRRARQRRGRPRGREVRRRSSRLARRSFAT